jgi:hypothetical protein
VSAGELGLVGLLPKPFDVSALLNICDCALPI